MSTKTKKVRPEIQALRAVGVAVVMIAHYWPQLIPGGYVFLDAFFVASGFLITGILLREIDRSGKISAPAFWVRRARRILPAALVVLLFCSVATFLIVPLNLWSQFFGEIQASALYFENWLLAHEAVNYFAENSQPSPVQHYWTLSFEEQFYFAWPVLLLALIVVGKKFKKISTRKLILFSLIIITVVSFIYSVIETNNNQAAAYFSTPGRIWEITIGGILAFIATTASFPRLKSVLSWLGIITLFIVSFLYGPQTPYPGVYALIPVFAILAVIWAGVPSSKLSPGHWMKLKSVQWTGDASYSIYLWHWPLLILAPFLLDEELNNPVKIVLIILTIILSALSKRYIEDPLRSGPILDGVRPRKIFFLSAAAISVVLLSTLGALYVLKNNQNKTSLSNQSLVAQKPACLGAASRDPYRRCNNPLLSKLAIPNPSQINSDFLDSQIKGGSKVNCPTNKIFSFESVGNICQLGTKIAKEHYALVGDSHALHWQPAFAVVAKQEKWQVSAAGLEGCALSSYFNPFRGTSEAECSAWKKDIIKFLGQRPTIDTLFVAQRAPRYINQEEWERNVQGFIQEWRKLPPSIKKIIVLRDTPRGNSPSGNDDDPSGKKLNGQCIIEALDNKDNPGQKCALSRYLVLYPDPAVEAAKRFKQTDTKVLDFTPFFCGKSFCYPVVGGLLTILDASHISPDFSRTLAPYLLREFDQVQKNQ